MVNTFSPNGFAPVRRRDGAVWDEQATVYKIASNNSHSFFKGDPVIRLTTGYVDVNASYPTQGPVGIFIGCKYLSKSQGKVVWSASYPGADAANDIDAYVMDDSSVIMRAWVGTGSLSAAGGPVVFADIGDNIAYQYGTGNTLSGLSGAYVDYSTKLDTSTLPFTIIGQVSTPPGMNGTDIASAGNLIEVVFNQQTFKVGTTGSAAS